MICVALAFLAFALWLRLGEIALVIVIIALLIATLLPAIVGGAG